jgi:glycosyltransferase involved in cell wall biosynthesis
MLLSDTGGAHEIIDDSRIGEVLPDLEPSTWAAALKRAYDSRAEWQPAAEYRSERVRSTFTVEKFCERFLAVVDELMARRKR